MNEVRLIIVTLPPSGLCARLETMRAAASSFTGATAALAYPPHVTLRTGALVPVERLERFAAGMRASLGSWKPFPIRAAGLFMTGYRAEDGGSRFLVAWRILADHALLGLHSRLLVYTQYQRRPQPPFEPHLTLAFDDIAETDADRLLRHVNAHPDLFLPELEWPCRNVCLCREGTDGWEPYITLRAIEELK